MAFEPLSYYVFKMQMQKKYYYLELKERYLLVNNYTRFDFVIGGLGRRNDSGYES